MIHLCGSFFIEKGSKIMYKKIIQYKDYNGEDRKEPFYFNLEEVDIMRYQFEKDGGYQNYLTRLLATNKTSEAFEIFEKFIADSYGVKSDDGKTFIKNEKVLNEFKQSRAYSTFLMELMTVEGAADKFFEGIMPAAMIAQMSSKINGGKLDPNYLNEMVYGKEGEAEDTVVSDTTVKEETKGEK